MRTVTCGAFLAWATLCACNPGGSSSDGGTDASSTGDGGTGDGGTVGDGGATGPYSQVSLFQSFFDLGNGNTVVSSFATASFTTTTPPSSCTIAPFGPCNVVTCPTAVDGGVAVTHVNAGTVTITTPTIATDPLVLVSDANGTYTSPDGGTAARPMQIFSGGDPVSFSVAGAGNVSAFQGTVAAPSFVDVTDPAIPDGGTQVVVQTSTDLAVAWDVHDTPSGQIDVSIDAQSSGIAARCSFNVADGSGTIPKAALQALPLGPAAFTFATSATTTVAVANLGSVGLTVFSLPDSTSGGTVLLQ
jgi:hypothetical protein